MKELAVEEEAKRKSRFQSLWILLLQIAEILMCL
jgi:hypothetical protein